jgi:branched-chain amino acid transport system permease protein
MPARCASSGPDIARTDITFDMVMAMLVGGTGTLLGPLLGAAGTVGHADPAVPAGLPMLVFGPVLILLIIFVPDGIVGSFLKRQSAEPPPRAVGRWPPAPAQTTPSHHPPRSRECLRSAT